MIKSIGLLLLFAIIGFGIATILLNVQQQQTKQLVAKQASENTFSLAKAPSESLQGKIASFSGSVQWQSRVATQPATLKQPQTIQQGEELFTGKDGNIVVELSNGLRMSLLPNSHVNFIQTLPTSIVIKQDKGKVTYNNDVKSNLSVTSLSLLTSLPQGTMTLNVNSDQDTILNLLTSGVAQEAYNDTNNNTQVTNLTAGKTFSFDDTSLTSTVN
jgi:hypothetical protein